LWELVIKQSNKMNMLEQEHYMQPQLPSLMAGQYLPNKEIRRGPAPGNGRGRNGESVFKSLGIQALQPWETEEKKKSADQEEDNSEWLQEMKERSRRESNIIIWGLKQDSEQEDGYRRKAHDINQVVVIGKIKCPNLTEDNIREMIVQVRREGAYSKEHSSRPLKVVLKPEAREFRTMMLQRCPALQRANAELKTIIRVQEDVTPKQAKIFWDCQSKVE
jgi:hypothetical protein